MAPIDFESAFSVLTSGDGPPKSPFPWQTRLHAMLVAGDIPKALDLPTGLGKTSAMAVWLLARAENPALPRRLVYVVDRRAIVDQASIEAERLRDNLLKLPELAESLGPLAVSTLRGGLADSRDWMARPEAMSIIVGTVDMIGSRLLFSGYGLGARTRSMAAGLLGYDTLVLIDEAHLVPPFAELLSAISEDARLHARVTMPVAPLRVMRLSATQGAGPAFTLDAADLSDPTIIARIGARKRIERREGSPADALAIVEEILAEKPARVAVFLDSLKQVGALLAALRKAGIHAIPFTGARRLRERTLFERELRDAGFLAGSEAVSTPTVLVATSAAEVGVDLDADHAVMDLVAWERMVQRLGRVNRRGTGDARIIVLDEVASESRGADLKACRHLLDALEGDASPQHLREIAKAHPLETSRASTPQPLRPALTRAVAEAWAMTGLEDNPGRPGIEPFLRGWIEEEEPQAQLAWRCHLPRRRSGSPVTQAERDAWFLAAPLHLSEMLEVPSGMAETWLFKRVGAPFETRDEAPIRSDEIVAMAVDDRNRVAGAWRLDELRRYGAPKAERNPRAETERDVFLQALRRHRMVIDARLGGLETGQLSEATDAAAAALDHEDAPDWQEQAGFRVIEGRRHTGDEATEALGQSEDVVELHRFVTAVTAEGEASEWLSVLRLGDDGSGRPGDGASRGEWLTLDAHTADVVREAVALAAALGITDGAADALTNAAHWHDRGKASRLWQRAMGGSQRSGGPWAKTPRGNGTELAGYRHEFGSLVAAEGDPAIESLSDDLRDLVLHLVACHHGHARPGIPAQGCEDAMPSIAEGFAARAAFRFARLQREWGPWGLAWWESVFRAADWRASAKPGGQADG